MSTARERFTSTDFAWSPMAKKLCDLLLFVDTADAIIAGLESNFT